MPTEESVEAPVEHKELFTPKQRAYILKELGCTHQVRHRGRDTTVEIVRVIPRSDGETDTVVVTSATGFEKIKVFDTALELARQQGNLGTAPVTDHEAATSRIAELEKDAAEMKALMREMIASAKEAKEPTKASSGRPKAKPSSN